MPGEAARILLVDDNPGDQRLTQEALKEAGFPHQLEIVEDGVQAIEYLTCHSERNEPQSAEEAGVDLIILDLNLPRKDGREVLEELQRDPQLRLIPVVVLSSSDANEDRMASVELRALEYHTKPMDIGGYYALIRSLERFCRR